MAPAVAAKEAPVCTRRSPLLPRAENPEVTARAPLSPADAATAVAITTDPEPELVLAAELICALPPTNWPRDAPAESRMSLPLAESLAPTTNCSEPPRPLVAVPETINSTPLLPDDDAPLPATTAPEDPCDDTSAVAISTLPEPLLALPPL
jgi:hypothetical protein